MRLQRFGLLFIRAVRNDSKRTNGRAPPFTSNSAHRMESPPSAPTETRHLLSVWNPAYGTDVMETHIALLRDRAKRYCGEADDEDDVYVWWGKIRSSRRQEALKHLDDVLAVGSDLIDADGVATREVQLYLTHYRSLYVGHVAEITTDDPRKEDSATHIPPVYLGKEVHCDCWFRLWDIRRLVSDDTPAVVDELKKLSNKAYHDMPVSIYGGMVDLPLIVTRPDGTRFFEDDVRDQMTGGAYWVEFDSEHSGIGATERELRENHFGEDLWARLDPGARTFIATAEKLYRDHRNDASFDFSPVVLGLAKAFEVQTNALLRNALRRVKPQDRFANVEGRSVDVASGGPWSLGQRVHLSGENQSVNDALKRTLDTRSGAWVAASLPAILAKLAEVRNPAAHSASLDRESVRTLRNRYIGVGCEGALVRLARVTVKS